MTNYPLVEDYLFRMAKKGWMIKKIILGTFIIFQATEKRNLVLSITQLIVYKKFVKKNDENIELGNNIDISGLN